jgi:predicted small integral membrane protein
MDTAKVSVTSYGTVAATNNKYKYDDTLTLTNALLTGISTSSDTITFSGTADYSSNFTIMTINKTFALKTTMTFSSLKALKSTNKVSGGTVGITIQATIKGTTVSATGTITFNGNQTATLSFHNKQFVIDLNSGLVVA